MTDITRSTNIFQDNHAKEKKLSLLNTLFLPTPPRGGQTTTRSRGGDAEDAASNKSPRIDVETSPSRSRPSATATQSRCQSQGQSNMQATSLATATQVRVPSNTGAITNRAPPRPRVLRFGNEARAAAKETTAKKDMASLIKLYNEQKLFAGNWRFIPVPKNCGLGEGWAVRNTLELCQLVVTEDEIKSLEVKMNREELKMLAVLIQNRAFEHMWTLEGVTDIELEKQLEKKKSSSQQKKPFYGPMGRRVRNLKSKVEERTGTSELIICPPAQPAVNALANFGFGAQARATNN